MDDIDQGPPNAAYEGGEPHAGGADDRSGGRAMPHNTDAERALLAGLLLDTERVAEVAETLRPEDFFDRRLGHVFAGMVKLAEQGEPIDFVSLGEALRAMGRFQEIGGAEALFDLGGAATSSALVAFHARIVTETAILRNLIREATEIIGEAYETRPDGDAVGKLVDSSEHRIFKISSSRETARIESIRDAITETFKRLDARTGDGELTGLTTGFYELDDMLSGLNKGELIILAARPSMGKTAFALNLMENAAMSQPSWLDRSPSVLMFSLEMGRQSLVTRMLCSRAEVPAHLVRTGRIAGDLRQDLAQAADELQRARIHIDDTPGLSMMSVRSRARRLKAREGLDLIVVDYLQLLSFPKSESRQQEISSISRSLKELSRELEVPVIALAQLSRAVESRDPPRPQLADLRESGSIEQDADVVMMLYRAEYYAKYRTDENLGMAEVIVAKQRNGPTGDVSLRFFNQHMRFKNATATQAEPVNF
ncbi:MAG: replicative DNA helicase [Planctomycetota bacterium]